MRDALQPAPQQRGGADQRDDARKNAGQAHVIANSLTIFGGGITVLVQMKCK